MEQEVSPSTKMKFSLTLATDTCWLLFIDMSIQLNPSHKNKFLPVNNLFFSFLFTWKREGKKRETYCIDISSAIKAYGWSM